MPRTLKRLTIGAAAVLALAGAAAFGAAEYRLGRAGAELERFRPRAARRELARCPGFASWRAEYHLLAGRAARLLEEFDAAEEHLVECQRREGTPSEESTLEWALLRAQRGAVEPVEDFLRKQVDRHHPQSLMILDAMTRGYLRLYRRLEAMNCIRIWLERAPDHPRALLLRGLVHHRAHAFWKAAQDLSAVVEREPDNDEARRLLAAALIEDSRAPEAVSHLEMLRDQFPDDPDVLVKLAFAWNMAGRGREGLALLDRVLAEHPDFGPALSARGQLELQLNNDPAAAEGWLRRALRVAPNERQTHYALYQALQQQGRTAEAEAQQQRLKKIEAALTRMIEVANKLLPQRPRDAKLAHELGSLMKELGYVESAMSWFQKAAEYDPTFEPPRRELAEYLRKQGDANAKKD